MLPTDWDSDRDFDHAMGRIDEPDPEPAIDVTIDWPGESRCERYTRWADVFALLGPFLHIRQSRLLVSCFDEHEDTYVRLEYRPNSQQIAFYAGPHQWADERETGAGGWRR